MDTHAFGFRLPGQPPEGQKQFPISWHGHRHLRVTRVPHFLEAAEQKARAAGRPDAPQYKDPIQVGLLGLGCVTQPFKIRSNEIMSGEVGLDEVNSHLAAVEIRTGQDYKLFSCLIGQKSIQERLKLEIPERI